MEDSEKTDPKPLIKVWYWLIGLVLAWFVAGWILRWLTPVIPCHTSIYGENCVGIATTERYISLILLPLILAPFALRWIVELWRQKYSRNLAFWVTWILFGLGSSFFVIQFIQAIMAFIAHIHRG